MFMLLPTVMISVLPGKAVKRSKPALISSRFSLKMVAMEVAARAL
jgi:hypothetical protein